MITNDIIVHRYQDIDFMIVVTPVKDKPEKNTDKRAIYVRYNSPLGKIVVKTTLTLVYMASVADWQDYVCNVCLRTYSKAAPARIAAMANKNSN